MKLQFIKVTIIVAFLAFPIKGIGQSKMAANSKINFIENSWPEALKKAEAEHKNIFVDAYAVWCAPCKQLSATTFTDKKVAAFFNSNFVNLSIDTEKGHGIELANKWGLESYPTLYIFDSKGKLLSTSEGLINADALMKFGKGAVK
ncbi:MAG: thioredoxin family protein [Mucilaginibacter sp.]|uniref:thioredoxin family protein n=1 Tax=Mucilaginibacter sp. TaxID=1882438 RepID=UPI0034E53303